MDNERYTVDAYRVQFLFDKACLNGDFEVVSKYIRDWRLDKNNGLKNAYLQGQKKIVDLILNDFNGICTENFYMTIFFNNDFEYAINLFKNLIRVEQTKMIIKICWIGNIDFVKKLLITCNYMSIYDVIYDMSVYHRRINADITNMLLEDAMRINNFNEDFVDHLYTVCAQSDNIKIFSNLYDKYGISDNFYKMNLLIRKGYNITKFLIDRKLVSHIEVFEYALKHNWLKVIDYLILKIKKVKIGEILSKFSYDCMTETVVHIINKGIYVPNKSYRMRQIFDYGARLDLFIDKNDYYRELERVYERIEVVIKTLENVKICGDIIKLINSYIYNI
jgi:hypothetical protein